MASWCGRNRTASSMPMELRLPTRNPSTPWPPTRRPLRVPPWPNWWTPVNWIGTTACKITCRILSCTTRTSPLSCASLICCATAAVWKRFQATCCGTERPGVPTKCSNARVTSNPPVPSARNSVIKTSSTSPPAKWSSASPGNPGQRPSATRCSSHWAWSARYCQPQT